MTVINSHALLMASPLKPMVYKTKNNGVSHGLSEAGYDIRIAQDIRFWGGTTPRISRLNLKDSKPDLEYGRFTLASTIEEFKMPDWLVGIVHDKSTWARKGLSVFNTVIEPGWKGFLTLELVYHGSGDLHIPAGSGIAQVIFHELKHEASYQGKYQNQADKPVEAIFQDRSEIQRKRLSTYCTVCNAEQFIAPSGLTCINGHGGDPGKDLPE